jgi:uncharacterized damage-inducible protein DinB
MHVSKAALDAVYAGWLNYQSLLVDALARLNSDQLALQAAPDLRSIEAIATHMIGARGRWFAPPLGDGDKQLARLSRWDRRGGPVRSCEEIVQGLRYTLDYIQATISRWTPSDWQETFPGEGTHEPQVITRPWIIWHLIEHDLHHGGEISLTMGMYKLKAPDL